MSDDPGENDRAWTEAVQRMQAIRDLPRRAGGGLTATVGAASVEPRTEGGVAPDARLSGHDEHEAASTGWPVSTGMSRRLGCTG